MAGTGCQEAARIDPRRTLHSRNTQSVRAGRWLGVTRAGARLPRALGLGAGTALLGLVLTLWPALLEFEESLGLGWLFRWRGAIDPPVAAVVVSIDNDSAAALGLPSLLNEWPRRLHAELIDGLSRSGARALAFDVIFERARDPGDDAQLAEAIGRAGNVILLERVRSERQALGLAGDALEAVVETRVPPLERFREGALATAPFPLPVVPIRVSQFWAFGRGADDTPTLPAVALAASAPEQHAQLVSLLLELRPEQAGPLRTVTATQPPLTEQMRGIRALFNADPQVAVQLRTRIGDPRTASTSSGPAALLALVEMYAGAASRYLDYYGPPRTMPTLSYHSVLERLAAGGSVEEVHDKVVFVGFSEHRQAEQQDAFYSVFSDRGGANLSGVEIGATAFANLLEQRTVRPLPIPRQMLLVALWGVAIAAVCVFLPLTVSVPALVAAAGLYGWTSLALFSAQGLWLPLVLPLGIQLPAALLAALLLSYRQLERQRRRIQSALGYYVPADVVEALARESIATGASGRLLQGACLVTDADEYTALAETLAPDELAALLNDYYEVLFAAVSRHGGLVADVAGDSMVAVWAAARPSPDTRRHAMAAALEARAAVGVFNARLGRQGLPTRIGLDYGELVLGNIGAGARYEYRAVGDIVNTASRLQGLNRQLGTRILVSAALLEGETERASRFVGEFLLLGKQRPLAVYELLDVQWEPETVAALGEGFSAALTRFRAAQWASAERSFRELLEQFPDDGPSRYYVDICGRYQKKPPPVWDGVVRMTVK
jgi:adenylate cyclase